MRNATRLPAARYLFRATHEAICTLPGGVTVQPYDVSKGHLGVIADKSCTLPAGALHDVQLTVLGRTFDFPSLVIQQRREVGETLHVSLGGANAEHSDPRLWEVCHLLRRHAQQNDDNGYDEQTLPKVPARGLYTEEARQERLAFARRQTNATLTEVEHTRLEPRKLVSNVEAFIGSVEIPVGLSGPLLVKGVHADGLYYAPLATSEGALVASATRGATALSRSGGVIARVLGQRMMRVPLFGFDNMENALFFGEWIEDQFAELAAEVRKYSNFAQLVSVSAQVMGRDVHVHFVYETGDAAGQNMTTTCTWQACQWVLKTIKRFDGLHVSNFMIEANLSNDKKVTYQTFIKGRGVRVIAEAILRDDICQKILKVTAPQLVKAYQNVLAGAVAAGMVGVNVNVANIVAAMFTALGQDIACVHESALGQLHMELTEDGHAYCSMTMPSLVIGTVGGGTNLPQQRECLELLDCAGPGNAHKLGEIIVGYCLALDISTLSAIAADQFARAHEKLGRNRPVHYLKLSDLNTEFFNATSLRERHPGFDVVDAEAVTVAMAGSSIITELTSHKINKLVGHFPYRLALRNGRRLDVLAKVKPLDDEVIIMLSGMAAMCEPRLAQQFHHYRDQLGFKGCHVRELAVMSQTDPRFVKHAPVVYGVCQNAEREAYVLVEERLQDMVLMDSADDTRDWSRAHVEAAIRGIAEVHSIWYGKEDEVKALPWRIDIPTAAGMAEKRQLWELLGVHAREEFPEWFSEDDLAVFRAIVNDIDSWWADIERLPRTLVHNDFNPRNIAFRQSEDGLRLCAYDWELAALHLPQHDLAELLAFTLNAPLAKEDIDDYLELHRSELERHSGRAIDKAQWRYGYKLALRDLLVNRLPMYLMAHTFRHYGFMERVYRCFRELLVLEGVRVE